MSTHAFGHHAHPGVRLRALLSSHWTWLGIGMVVAFATPFLLADVLDLNRDLFYGLYAAIVLALFLGWARATGYDLATATKRHWLLAVTLGLACAALLAVIVLRTEDATTRPDGLTLGAELAWRGVLYGATDGLLLSAFPILVVFAAFSGYGFARRWPGKIIVGAIALTASIALTAAYHAGYSDFRSEKVAKPITGDLVWSVPTLVILNPIGARIAHSGLHTTAVLHSYDTDTFLPRTSRAHAASTPMPSGRRRSRMREEGDASHRSRFVARAPCRCPRDGALARGSRRVRCWSR